MSDEYTYWTNRCIHCGSDYIYRRYLNESGVGGLMAGGCRCYDLVGWSKVPKGVVVIWKEESCG